MAILTVQGLYNYDQTLLDGIIDNLPTPENISALYKDLIVNPQQLDSDAIINLIMYDCSELEFAITNPTVAKNMITMWARSCKLVWQNLYDTMYYKYNPIWNKDGTNRHTETRTGNSNTIDSTANTETTSSTETSTRTPELNYTDTSNITDENIRQVVGFNETSFTNAEKNTRNVNNDLVREEHGTDKVVTVSESGKTATADRTIKGDDNTDINYTDIEQGNIGVTSTQALIKEQREVVQFNIYSYIVNEFKQKFCLLVY